MRAKIISLIPSYNYNSNISNVVINELNKISKTILFTTGHINTVANEVIVCDPLLGKDLVYQTRKWIIQNIDDNWDYILYNEDDIFISDQSIYNVLKLYDTLPKEYVPGFLRYEMDNTIKRYIDMHPAHASHRNGFGTIKQVVNNLKIWEPWNNHSGNWLLSKSDILNLIYNDRFETYYNEFNQQYGNCDQLESSATSLYTNYIKVYPIDFKLVECWHMPNKYITMLDVKNGNPTLNELKQLIYASSNT